jgi:hypothetical protein
MQFTGTGTGKFANFISMARTDDAVEHNTRYNTYFIKVGFAGFNSPANNGRGYATQAKAEAAILRYQGKGGI